MSTPVEFERTDGGSAVAEPVMGGTGLSTSDYPPEVARPQEPLPLEEPGVRPDRPPHLPALTSLRFIAAMMIVIGHSQGLFGFPPFPWRMAHAVTFFFVLSGFVLTYNYPTLRGGKAVGRFYLNRFARIWPAYLVAMALALINDQHALRDFGGWVEANATRIGLNLTLTYKWMLFPTGSKLNQGIHMAAWSLSTLLVCYLVFPLLVHKFEKTWWWKLAAAFALAMLMIVLCNTTAMGDHYFRIGPYRVMNYIYGHFGTRIFEFTLGMVAALLWDRWFTRLSNWGRTVTWATIMEVGAVALTIAVMILCVVPGYWLLSKSWAGAPAATWIARGGLSAFPFALLLIVFATGGGYLSRVLSHPVAVWLGVISYSLYLVHPPIVAYYRARAEGYPDWPGPVLFAIFLILSLIAAHLLYLLVEQPARRFIRSLPDWKLRKAPAGKPRAPATPQPVRAGGLTSAAAVALATTGALPPSSRLARQQRIRWWSIVGAEAVAVCLLAGAWVRMSQAQPAVAAAATNEVTQLLANAREETLNVKFGDEFTLLGATADEQPNGAIILRMVWRADRATTLRYNIGVHTLDAPGGRPLRYADQRQSANASLVEEGFVWQTTVELNRIKLKDAKMLAICLYSGRERLTVDRGARDWNNTRLLIPIR